MAAGLKILSTRILRAEQEQRLRQAGVVLDMRPFIQLSYCKDIALPSTGGRPITAVFTSVHAVNAVKERISELPLVNQIYCIAGATERSVRDVFSGLKSISAFPYAQELAQTLREQYQGGELWLFRGDKALPTIPKVLSQAGIAFESIEVYRNIASPHHIDYIPDVLLFFSPSGVESYCSMNNIVDSTVAIAIGTTTAGALKGKAARIAIAAEPSEAAVVELALRYVKAQ